jgi:HSF-type DNA-binding
MASSSSSLTVPIPCRRIFGLNEERLYSSEVSMDDNDIPLDWLESLFSDSNDPSIERSPLRRVGMDRTQSASLRTYATVKPAKKARSVSAPHIAPLSDYDGVTTYELGCDAYAPLEFTRSVSSSIPQPEVFQSVTSHRPYPFFDYIDYSQEPDPDSETPLTSMGRVPTFPAKLHAILLRPDLQNIVSWLPHGRSWKVWDGPAFEKRVIAVYFEFTKHPNSSFFRQAKLWGFLRMKRMGPDKDSYYHPRFLRGLPHLCKDVRRPPASHLPDVLPEHEPDLTAISRLHPVPDSQHATRTDPTVRLDWFMKRPPGKESMTKKTSSTSSSTSFSSSAMVKRKRPTTNIADDHAPHPVIPTHIVPSVLVNVPPLMDLDALQDDEEEPIQDDLGLNLEPYFSRGYQLYPFYDYVDCSTEIDFDPSAPLTDWGQEPSFPALLHAILLQQQQSSSEPIISWQPHGRAWKIRSPTALETQVLPLFFDGTFGGGPDGSCTVASFLRQVTRWGFKRLQRPGPDYDCYYHPRFLRGLLYLCKRWPTGDSASSLSTALLTSEDELGRSAFDDAGELPEPDLTRISQLHPVPDYDAILHVHDILGLDRKL